MTPDDVRAAAEQLVDFHERFAPLFGKEQAQDHAYDYLKGLMVCPERKSIEPIALNGRPRRRLGPAEVRRRRPLGLRRRAGRGPGPLRRRAGPLGRRLPRRRRRGRRRECLHQEGDALRRGGAAAQRPARQGGQLPGRRLPDRGDPGGVGPAGPPAVPAGRLVRADARGPNAAGPRRISPRACRSAPSRGSPPS